jgi:hypothetical protein
MAGTGAQIGSVVPGIGTAIGAGIGAAAGGIGSLIGERHNDTKDQREDFAKQLGYVDTTALWNGLSSKLPADQANELRDRALNRIGKHDAGANQQWMSDVQTALAAAPPKRDAATAGTTPTAAVRGPQGLPLGTLTTTEQAPPGLPPGTVAAGQGLQGLPPLPAGSALSQTGWAGDPKDTRAWVMANWDRIKDVPGQSSKDPEYWIQRINENGGLVNGNHPADYWFGRMTHSDADYNAAIGNNAYLTGGGPGGVTGGDGSTLSAVQALTDKSTYQALVQKLQSILGAPATDRDALMSLLNK